MMNKTIPLQVSPKRTEVTGKVTQFQQKRISLLK